MSGEHRHGLTRLAVVAMALFSMASICSCVEPTATSQAAAVATKAQSASPLPKAQSPSSLPRTTQTVPSYATPSALRATPTKRAGALSTPTWAPPQLTINVPGDQFGQSSPDGRAVLAAGWGTGDGQFGTSIRTECPTAFDVDGDGNIYVLDNVNNRLQFFDRNGALVGSFPISKHSLDVSVARDGSLLVLEAYGTHRIVRYDRKGSTPREYPIASELGLVLQNGLLVREQDAFIRVLGPAEDPVPSTYQIVRAGQSLPFPDQIASKSPGQPARGGLILTERVVDASDNHTVDIAVETSDGRRKTIRLNVQRFVSGAIDPSADDAGTIYVPLYSHERITPTADRGVGGSQMTVVVLNPTGEYIGRIEMAASYWKDIAPKVVVAPDGGLYLLQAHAEGITISRWPPRSAR